MARINCGNCDQKHASVDEVRSCYGNSGRLPAADLPKPSDDELVAAAQQALATDQPASPRQVKYANDLAAERDIEGLPGELYERAFDLGTDKFLGRKEASKLIDALKALPKKGSTGATGGDVPEGIHVLNGDYLKVQVAVHGSGRKYAKRWNGQGWDYEPSAVSSLSEATVATAEQASAFGRIYGMCAYCSRDLTDERSIAAGYGPVCADKYGLPWGHVSEDDGATPEAV